MKKGYWIALVDVNDMEKYKAYQAANAIAFKKYSARFVTRGGNSETVEGKLRSRGVVIEFPSYQMAAECYRSPEYAHAISLRQGISFADIMIVEGYDGAQP